MLIDCDKCPVRGQACGECVVTVLLGPPSTHVEFDAVEQVAIARLARAGLVPPLAPTSVRQPGKAAKQHETEADESAMSHSGRDTTLHRGYLRRIS